MREVKKYVYWVLPAIIICIGLSACQNSPDTGSGGSMVVSNIETERVTEQDNSHANIVVSDISVSADSNSSTTATTEADEVKFVDINLGNTIDLDFTEIALKTVSIEKEVYPRDTSGVFMYLPEIDNKSYFQVVGSLKNISSAMYEVDNMIVQLIFDGKYTYDGYVKADAGVFRAYDYQVDPFETVDIHIIGEIPNELLNSFSKCDIHFGFANEFSRVRNMESCEYKYILHYSH